LKPLKVLVLAEGANRGALAAVRSLARHGHEVHVAGPGDEAVVARSRHVARRHRIPWPDHDLDGFAAGIAAARADVVLPASDATLLGLSLIDTPTTRPFPPDAVARLLDKRMWADHATALGIAVPRILPDDWTGRAVVKARGHGLADRVEAVVTDDPQAVAAAIRNAGGEPLLQEIVDGPLVALTVVVGPDGARRADVQQRAERVWPQPAGVSCRAVTESADPTLLDDTLRLLKDLGWWGVAQAQFLDGRLIDLNGRLYGSLALAIAAGVDVPNLLVDPGAPGGEGRPGLHYSWFEGDVRRAVSERRGGLVSDLRETLAAGRRSVPVLWSAADPMPALAHTAALARRALRKATARQ
jgi:hypothetical protein